MIKLLLAIKLFLKELIESIESLFKVLLLSKRTNIVRNLNLSSDDVVILGNGPSLAGMLTEQIDFLKNKDIVCVNHFPSTDFYEKIKPRYFISGAQDLYLENIEEQFIIQSNKLFNDINERTTWPIIFFFPVEAQRYKRWQNIFAKNKNIQICYYNTTPVEGLKSIRNILFDCKLGMARPHNVLIPSIFLMIWKGYKNIYLWGADHSWLKDISVDEQNNALINQKHFYDETTSRAKVLDWKGEGARKLHEIMYKFMTAFASYFVIEDYAKNKKIRIINMTRGSFIDAFERE